MGLWIAPSMECRRHDRQLLTQRTIAQVSDHCFTIYPNVLKQMRRGFGLGHTSGLFPAGSSEGTAFLADDRPL